MLLWTLLQHKQVLGTSCPMFPLWQDPFPVQQSSSSVFSLKTADNFCSAHLAAPLWLWRGIWRAPTTVVGPATLLQAVTVPAQWPQHHHHRSAGLQLCHGTSPSMPSWAQPTDLGLSLSPRRCPWLGPWDGPRLPGLALLALRGAPPPRAPGRCWLSWPPAAQVPRYPGGIGS